MNNPYADERQESLYKKFPSTHFLSNPNNVHNTLLWSTFFRRNLHRLAIDYLGIKLHIYQQLILYLMGISQLIVIVASRAAAKSFIIALYACCKAIIKPNSRIVLGSATRGQSKLIISEKIKNELMNMSPALRKEIRDIKDSANESIVYFKNGSTIKVFTANQFARGLRSTDAVREEFRQIDKEVDDSVISPFQTIRQAPYMIDPYYSSIEELKEDPIDIYISSSWFLNDSTNGGVHWMWNLVDQAYDDMLDGGRSAMLAFDESITLKHNIRTQRQMQQEKKKQDPITWKIEFLNLRVKDSESAFFTYSMLTENQRLKQVFYPRKNEDVRCNKKNKYTIPKQDGEIRVVSCDIAFVAGKQNDNSIYSCIRAIPETMTYESEDSNSIEVKQGYRRQYCYIESNQMGDTTQQAIRIRQLYDDFDADYIVLDCRNGGLQILYSLGKTLYDEQRGLEYSPFKCMNNQTYADAIKTKSAKEVIYAINATQQLNSDMAYSFRRGLIEKKIDLLISYNEAKEELLKDNKDYMAALLGDQNLDTAYFEIPFIETQLLISECAELVYEKAQQTGIIKISEKGSNRKDRYSSCSMGNYFIDSLEVDLLGRGKQVKSNISSLTSLARKPKLYSH